MKVDILRKKAGMAALLTMFSLSAIHAFNDYGITTNKLHNEILAQRNSYAGGQSSGGSSVDCCCSVSIVGWGEGCKADNYGSRCATNTDSCWNYDRNCKGGSSSGK